MTRHAMLLLLCAVGTAHAQDPLITEAEKLWEANKVMQALPLALQAVKKLPKEADAHGILARVRMDLNEFDAAMVSMAKANELSPRVWGNLYRSYKARVAFFYGKDDEARAGFKSIGKLGAVSKKFPFLIDPPGMTQHRLKRGHYAIYVDAKLAKLKTHIYVAKLMEAIHRYYSKIMPFKGNGKLVHRVYVLGSQNEYEAFNSARGILPDKSAGRYSPTYRIIVVNADPRKHKVIGYGLTEDTIDTMFHEGFHQFIHQQIYDVPDWFNEAFAEYFGPSQVLSAKKLRIGIVKKKDPAGYYTRYSRLKELIEGRRPGARLTSLRDFTTMRDAKFRGAKKSQYYAEAWGLMHFLLHAPALRGKGKKWLRKMFLALKAGKSRHEAWKEAFGGVDFDQLDRMFVAYIKAL